MSEISEMFNGGKSATDTVRTLTAKKPVTPRSYMQRYGIIKESSPVPNEKRYLWIADITTILE